jgi:hypothetical protein
MTFYAVILFLHIVAAIGIFVGLGLEWVSTSLFRKAVEAADFRASIGALRSVPMLFGSSGALVLLTGGYLAAKIGRAGVSWVVPSLAALVVIGALSGALTGRRLRRIRGVHLAGTGPVPIGLRALVHDPLLVASLRVRLSLALGIVYLMTAKPALVPSLVVLVCATLAGLIVSVQTFRRPRTLEMEA